MTDMEGISACCRIALLVLFLCRAVWVSGANDIALAPALTLDAVDWQNCRAYAGEIDLGPAPQAALAARLGLAPSGDAWSTGSRPEEFRRFVVSFCKPVTAGTLLLGGGVTQVAVLREDAPYPGNPADDRHWDVQASGAVLTWPVPLALRALRITQRNSPQAWEPNSRPSLFPDLLLLRGRYASALRLGGEEWREAGGKREWVGNWVRGQCVAGLAVFGAPPPVAIRVLPDGVATHPLQAPPPLWSALTPAAVQAGDPRLVVLSGSSAILAIAVDAPVAAGKAPPPRIVPLVPLADGESLPRLLPEMPVAVEYDMPMTGFAAVHIRDAGGRPVRRLVAEVERTQGPVREGWNLRDDDDRPVPPGTYHWTLLARPPLKLTYEGTVYNAGNPPWRAPVPGGGWWMADHSPPASITAVGDRMVMAALGAEFGTPLIITDPDGRKVWHDGEFGSHSGAARLVSDGTAAYAVNDDNVTRIIPGSNVARRVIHTFAYSDVLPGHAHSYIAGDRSGAAAKPGVLCVSYHAPEPPWIRSALKAGHLDLKRSFPPVIQRKVHETALTPDEEVTSAFQIGMSSRSAGFGDAVTKGPLANTLVLALRRKVPIGSVVLPPGNVTVYALRPGKEMPSSFDQAKAAEVTLEQTDADAGLDDLMADFGGMDQRFPEDTWIALRRGKDGSRPGIAVPETGMETSALVFSGPALKRLPYALALDRRYRDIAPEATLVALEGAATREGGWSINRASSAPISAGSPAVAALVWAQPIEARGYLLAGPMAWAGLTVDVWSGADDAVIDKAAVAEPANWRRVQTHRQTRDNMKYNWHTPMTLLGDFGSSAPIRALRVSVNEHPVGGPGESTRDVRGGFEGLVVFQPLGRDPELPRTLAERITVLNLPPPSDPSSMATLRGHLAFDKPGALAFAPGGDLLADTAQGIVRIAAVETQTDPAVFTVVVPRQAYRRARALAVDAEGLIYLLDAGHRQILVFDPATGREVRRIGKPGGQLGPFDPESFTEPSAMTLDPRGKLWVVEQHFQPKRISRWSCEGAFEKDFLGPTHYGGGGMMDPGDRSVINHLGMKFRMNWADRTWKLESRLAPYSGNFFCPDRVVYAHGHRYLIGDRRVVTPFGDPGPIAVICEEINGVAVPVVAAGILENWDAYRGSRAMQQAYRDGVKAATAAFIWSDRNRDRTAQVEEVAVLGSIEMRPGLNIGDDLSLNFLDGYRLRAASVQPDGVPVYDIAALERIPEIRSEVMVDASGRTFVMGHTFLDAAGRPLWRYPDEYGSVQGSMKTPWGMNNRPPGVLSGSFNTLGHFEIGGEHLFCVGSNDGDYYAFTDDGILAAAILGGPRGYGRRYFSMADCRPGITDMSDLRKTVEDFHGSVTRAEDGHVYAIAGKNHVSILRVDGLEAMQRRQGVITVTSDDAVRTERWIAERAAVERQRRQPGSVTVPYVSRALKIDGDILMDWPEGSALTVFERRDDRDKDKVAEQVTARLAYDETSLYVSARATDASPMRNAAMVPTMIIQQGDAFDLHLGLDPQADPARLDPVAGDVRLLFATLQGKDSVVLLRYVPGAAPLAGEPYTYTSPMGSVPVADAGVLTAARVVLRRDSASWVLEAAVPWASLGVAAPAKTLRLRGDLGVLMSDPEGISTVARHYWANRENVVLGDLPAEARIHPALWNDLDFVMPSDGDLLMDAMREPPPSLDFPALK